MDDKYIGKGIKRKDAIAKVQGKAKYTEDLLPKNTLHGKVLRSTIAHGYVKKMDISKALELEGVIKVLTPDDVIDSYFATSGHPMSLDKNHQDIADRKILTDKIRYYGDEIAAVIAKDALTAQKALRLIEVEYEELPVLLDAEDAMKDDAVLIHNNSNILGQNEINQGDISIEEAFEKSDYIFTDEFEVHAVQHCQMENQIAYAYLDENQKITVVSSTQIPHICRRILSDALKMPISKIRVVKPYIGGGFGNKQDIIIEPLVAMMSLAVDGQPVVLEYSREEVMRGTRTRHGVKFYLKTGVNKDGTMTARYMKAIGNNGAYASHGHNIIAKIGTNFYRAYPAKLATKFEGYTVYTNKSVAGAMRAYGIPQVNFAVESHLDDIAKELGIDSIEFRLKNMHKEGFVDPISGIKMQSVGLPACIQKAKEYINWDEQRKIYDNQTGNKRIGLGISCFSYATGVWPFALEISGARLSLNQDGSFELTVGATEIGQGSDTVFCQMAAEVIGTHPDNINIRQNTDTDIAPFDTGAYASRQSYVSGQAVKKASKEIKEEILIRASEMKDINKELLDIEDSNIISNNGIVCTLGELALYSYYALDNRGAITKEVSVKVESNALAYGVSVAKVEVDIPTGRIEILDICNIHDSGKILNPVLASAQVEGGMSMSIGYGIFEKMEYHPKTGKLLNDNLLDYKMPTTMDMPEVHVGFVETYEPTGPFGNKALGEPPAVSPATAIRNAVVHACNVKVNELPMSPQALFERFKEAGLI